MSDYVNVRMPPMLRKEADLYVEGGYFVDRSELIREAIREFLERHRNKKIDLAAELYSKGKISIGMAAELAGVSYERMRDILAARDIKLRLGPESVEEAEQEYKAIKQNKAIKRR